MDDLIGTLNKTLYYLKYSGIIEDNINGARKWDASGDLIEPFMKNR